MADRVETLAKRVKELEQRHLELFKDVVGTIERQQNELEIIVNTLGTLATIVQEMKDNV